MRKLAAAFFIAVAVLLLPGLRAGAEPLAAGIFAYDASLPLEIKVLRDHQEGSLRIEEITFRSPAHGLIHAQLILPRTKSHRSGVLFVHWLGDPKTTNLTEFHRDAATVAGRGSVALLVDAMWAQPDWYEKGRTPETDFTNSIEQVIDLRRALDVLLAQPGVEPHRIAYVGHDFGAMYGSILSGIDRRVRWYVLMAGNPSFEKWYTYEAKPKDPAAFAAQMARLAPGQYLAQSKAQEFLFQFANKDQYISAQEAQEFVDSAPLPHGMFVYRAGHSLDVPEAFADRMAWLEERLNPAP